MNPWLPNTFDGIRAHRHKPGGPSNESPAAERSSILRAASQKSTCTFSLANRAVMIDTDKYPLDWVHYTAAGQIQFGLDILKAAAWER